MVRSAVAADVVAEVLEDAPPGSRLTAVLDGLEPADLGDGALVEGIAAWERVMAWGLARQAELVRELARRREAQGCAAYVGDEVAARLGWTRHAGEARVGLAVGLDRLPPVGDALASGGIDLRKATVLTEDLLHVPVEVAVDTARAVLPDAPRCTPPQLRAALRRLEIARDPAGAGARHDRARADRHVQLTPALDSMAWLSAYLPADDAVAVYTSLTAIADAAPADDPRPVGARRADALVSLATRWLDAGSCPEGRLPVRQGRRPHLAVTASATTLLGIDEQPADLAGYGPIPAPMARRIAARSTWEPLLLDARTGQPLARSTHRYTPTPALRAAVLDRDVTCVFPGCRTPAERCDIDHISPYRRPTSTPPPTGGQQAGTAPSRTAGTCDAGPTDGPQTSIDNLHALCRHHHRAKTHAGWTVTRDPVEGITRWLAPTGHRYDRAPAATAPGRDAPAPPPHRRIDVAWPRRRPPRPTSFHTGQAGPPERSPGPVGGDRSDPDAPPG